MSEQPKQLKNAQGDPIEVKCSVCGNTDPVLFGFIEDEPTRRDAKLVRDNGTLVFEGVIAKHYYEAATNSRLECRNEVPQSRPRFGRGSIASACGTEVDLPSDIQIDFE